MSAVHVTQLLVYPVKSLRGISVDSFTLTASGPQFDRRWMVVNDSGQFLTQRRLARMCLIETRIEAQQLILSLPGTPAIEVPCGGGDAMQVTVWRDQVSAEDCGDAVASWLSDFLDTSCRMVYLPDGYERAVPDTAATVGFADAYPLLLTSESSLADFNTHLTRPVEMNRFRPNIVIAGAPAYAEDGWREIQVGKQSLQLNSPCSRCIVPSIDQHTAEQQQQVIDALNQHRRFGTETRFGQNLSYQQFGAIRLGESVEVLS